MNDAYEAFSLHCRLYSLRRKWMGLLGFDDMEVKESVKKYPPTSLEEEQKQLEAAERLSRS